MIPDLGARGTRTDPLTGLRRLIACRDRTGRRVDLRPIGARVLRRANEPAVGAIENEQVPVAIEVREQLATVLIEEDRFADAVIVPHIVRSPLIVPTNGAVVRIERHDATRIEVRPGPFSAAEYRRRIPGAPIQQIELRVIRPGDPRRTASACPRAAAFVATVRGPALTARLPGLRHRVPA